MTNTFVFKSKALLPSKISVLVFCQFSSIDTCEHHQLPARLAEKKLADGEEKQQPLAPRPLLHTCWLSFEKRSMLDWTTSSGELITTLEKIWDEEGATALHWTLFSVKTFSSLKAFYEHKAEFRSSFGCHRIHISQSPPPLISGSVSPNRKWWFRPRRASQYFERTNFAGAGNSISKSTATQWGVIQYLCGLRHTFY